MPLGSRCRAFAAGGLLLLGACAGPIDSTPAPSSPAAPSPAVPGAEFPVAGDFHVAPDGDDQADGSALRPWRTLQHAAEAGNGTIAIAAGEYEGFSLRRSGTADDPLTFIGPADGSVVVRPGAATPDVIHVSGAHDIVLRSLTITGAAEKYAAGLRIDGGASNVAVLDSRIVDNTSFGVEVSMAREIGIRDSEISGNEVGIRLIRPDANPAAEVTGVEITGNQIHDNDRLVVNDRTLDNDFGANGIILHETTGQVLIQGNTFSHNRGESRDYGTDGGAIEIWAASNATVTDNVMVDNENVMETGTYGPGCENLTVTRNVAYRTADQPIAAGLILRCAAHSLVAHNTLVDIDWFAFHVSDNLGQFGGSVAGLRIVNNIVFGGRSYLIDTTLPADVQFDYNLLDEAVRVSTVAPTLASIEGVGPIVTVQELRDATGLEAHGIAGQPTFVDLAAADFRLAPGSLGIDAGTSAGGQAFQGAAPDMGRFESGG